MSKIKEAMEKLKTNYDYCRTDVNREIVDKCIEIYESNLPTREEIVKKWGALGLGLGEDKAVVLIRELWLLRKEKVRRWKWTNGQVTTNDRYSQEEFDSKNGYFSGSWWKVQASEVEEDVQ